MSEREDWEPFPVITITRDNERKSLSKYNLDFNGLQRLLEPIGDKPVVVIPIVGSSRMGKSFILNYMCRYLSDPLNDNWMGSKDKALEGFGWASDTDPQTSGLWLSKPFVLRQSNGNEIAVLLMDTQGVFDKWSNKRDWSTIVGISLLMSSLIIFNVMRDLQDDILMNFDQFLEYGLLASKALSGDDNSKPFQSLMFLIRDWGFPQKYRHGLKGGKEFLKDRLTITEELSETAKTIRQQLVQCFSDVSCFLMPKIGEMADEEGFNGSVGGLSRKFVDKMEEFISNSLHCEELKPKTIDNKTITANEFCLYFKTYVQIFNSDELPKPTDIIEATAKTTDFIEIQKLKETHFNQLKAFIESKPFIARRLLVIENKTIRDELIQSFGQTMKSNNKDIIKELIEMFENLLNDNFKQIFEANERQRDQSMTKAVNESQRCLERQIEAKVDNDFFESNVLDVLFNSLRKSVFQGFKTHFGEEDEELFANDFLKLKSIVEMIERNVRTENNRRMIDAKRLNSIAVDVAIAGYKQDMNDILQRNVYLNKDMFKQMEKQINERSCQHFKQICINGNQEFIKGFELDFNQRLKEEKQSFKTQFTTQCKLIEANTHKDLISTIEEYYEQMDDVFNSVVSEEELIEKHETIKCCFDQFVDNCLIKDPLFLDRYSKYFNERTDKILSELLTKLIERKERLKSYVNEVKDLYIKRMDEKFEDKELLTTEELNDFNDEISCDVLKYFQELTDSYKGFETEIEFQSNRLKQTLNEEFNRFVNKNKTNRKLKEVDLDVFTNGFVDQFEEQMDKHMGSMDSMDQLNDKLMELKTEITTQFKDNYPVSDSLDVYFDKLEQKIEISSEDFRQILDYQLKNQISVDKDLKIKVRKYYTEEMEKFYQKTSFLSKENLNKSNEKVLNIISDKFETERGNMSYDKYKQLIEDSVKDIFQRIKADNDMNAPTLRAIGIDLGTTNSCVAYFKPDRKNPYNVVVINNELGRNTTPSVVSIRDNEEVVGNVAKNEINAYPYNTVFSAKRLIGRKFSDILVQNYLKNWSFKVIDDGVDDNPKISLKVNGTDETYFAEQISSKVLKHMKEIAEKHLGVKVTKAVITVPAYFNDSQKEATKDAGLLAGLEVLKIINEPTAAAIAFKLNRSEDTDIRKVLIYDFGGGTFDVAVLVIQKGDIVVKAVGGDNQLGGDDFDNNIVEYCLDEFKSQTAQSVDKAIASGAEAISRLRLLCEERKCDLSSVNETAVEILGFYNGYDLRVELTRDMFEQLNNGLFIKSMDLVAQTLEDANMSHSDIDDIVLVGGSTRIPKIQELLSDQFNGRPLSHVINPDEAVAVGAAIQAAILNGEQAQGLGHLMVKDVAPMSLGVKVVGGFMSVIINRNSNVPNSYERVYSTNSDFQTTVRVEVFEGEEDIADNNRLLGDFTVNGIPPAAKGDQNIKVVFEITDEGILRVSARILSTGAEEEIEIKEHKGRLSDQELENMIAQGF